MEGNRDESERCIEIAVKALVEGKLETAEKFLNKAEKLYPSDRAKELLTKIKSIPTQNGTTSKSGSTTNGIYQRRNAAPPKTDSKPSEPDYTSEQLEAVKRIKKCKDYYEVLMVTKEATDSEIKKSYKKLALQLHPDKNKAPGSVEAFKAIGNAVAILTDPGKRKSYDLHGNDDFSSGPTSGRRHYANDFAYTRGFESDVTAEELFNMFFGGGFPQTNVYNRQRRFHRSEPQHQRDQNNHTALINLLPILLLVGLSLITTYFISEPIYNLQPNHKYSVQRRTNQLKIPYYVKDNFHKEYQGSVGRLEASVEEEYMNHLRHSCARERNYKDSLLAKARTFADRDLYKKAQGMNTPSCDTLQKILLHS